MGSAANCSGDPIKIIEAADIEEAVPARGLNSATKRQEISSPSLGDTENGLAERGTRTKYGLGDSRCTDVSPTWMKSNFLHVCWPSLLFLFPHSSIPCHPWDLGRLYTPILFPSLTLI